MAPTSDRASNDENTSDSEQENAILDLEAKGLRTIIKVIRKKLAN